MCFDTLALKAIKEQCADNAKQHQEAEQRGQRDYWADYELSDNPYPMNTQLHVHWKKGFLRAHRENQGVE